MSNTKTHFSHVKTHTLSVGLYLIFQQLEPGQINPHNYQVKWVTMSSAIQVTNTKCTWMFIVQYICIHLKDSPLLMTILFSHKVHNYMQTYWLDSQKCFQKLVLVEFYKETFRSPAHIQVICQVAVSSPMATESSKSTLLTPYIHWFYWNFYYTTETLGI